LQESELRQRIDRDQSQPPSSTRYYNSHDQKVRDIPLSALSARRK
jgi:hypothetical protein